MVEIKLDRTYYILSDARQWILARKNPAYNPKDSKSSEFFYESFFSGLDNLIKSYIMLNARLCNAKTLEELNGTIKNLSESLQALNFDNIKIDVIIKPKGD